MRLKKIIFSLLVVFAVSSLSSIATWQVLTKNQERQVSWKELLKLTPEQETRFVSLESEFGQALKEMEADDARNKIDLCSYLGEEKTRDLKSAAEKMGKVYTKKQEKIGMTLASISSFLQPEQRKIFAQRLMQEVCVSCRKSTGSQKCLCGMCNI